MHPRHLIAAALAIAVAVAAGCEPPDGIPSQRTLRIIVGDPPGGAADHLGRLIASEMRAIRPAVVENHPGNAGVLAAAHVARASRPGETLLLGSTDALTLAPLLDPTLPYRMMEDLCPIALVAQTPHVLLVDADSAYRTVADVIEDARRRPEEITYASLGGGTSSHAIGALFSREAGVSLVHVAYRGSGPATRDILGGHVDIMFGTLQSTATALDSGQFRALATSAAQRPPHLPGVPTFAEAGLPALTSSSWHGVFAPCALPRSVQDEWASLLARVLDRGAIASAIAARGAEAPRVSGERFEQYLQRDAERWREVAALLR